MAPHGRPPQRVPRFEVNLDVAPERRWDAVMLHFKSVLGGAVGALEGAFLPDTRAARVAYAAVVLCGGLIVHPAVPVTVLAAVLWAAGVSAWWWLGPLALFVAGALCVPFRREVAGISRAAGIPAGKILLVQYVYEFVSACTSVVVRDATSSVPVHLRVMDWQMQGMDLTALVCEVTFTRRGRPVFVATTWAGLVGVFTGMTCRDPDPDSAGGAGSPGDAADSSFSVSLNFRTVDYDGRDALYETTDDDDGGGGGDNNGVASHPHRGASSPCIQWHAVRGGLLFLRTLVCLSCQGFHATGGTLIRRVLARERSFPAAAARLRQSWLTSPVYLIVAGEKPTEGVCLARSRYGVDGEYGLAPLPEEGNGAEPPGSAFVSQCNSDWWTHDDQEGDCDPLAQLVMHSGARQRKRGQGLLAYAACGGAEQRWEFLSTEPIWNELSVYACIMCPRTQTYATRVRLEPLADSDSESDSDNGDGNDDGNAHGDADSVQSDSANGRDGRSGIHQ